MQPQTTRSLESFLTDVTRVVFGVRVVALHVPDQVSLVFKDFTTYIASLQSIQELLLATIVILELLLLLLVLLGVEHVPHQVRHRDAVRHQGLVLALLNQGWQA